MKMFYFALVMLVYLANSARCAAAEGDPDYEFSKATMKRIVKNGQQPISVFSKKKGEGAVPGGAIVLNADGSVENKDSYILFTTGAQLGPGGKFGPVKSGDVFFNIGDFPVKVGDYVLKKGEAVLYNGQKLETITLLDEAGKSDKTPAPLARPDQSKHEPKKPDSGTESTKPGPDRAVMKAGKEKAEQTGKNPIFIVNGSIVESQVSIRNNQTVIEDKDMIINAGTEKLDVFHDGGVVLELGEWAISTDGKFKKQEGKLK